jgi:hypothetical protein
VQQQCCLCTRLQAVAASQHPSAPVQARAPASGVVAAAAIVPRVAPSNGPALYPGPVGAVGATGARCRMQVAPGPCCCDRVCMFCLRVGAELPVMVRPPPEAASLHAPSVCCTSLLVGSKQPATAAEGVQPAPLHPAALHGSCFPGQRVQRSSAQAVKPGCACMWPGGWLQCSVAPRCPGTAVVGAARVVDDWHTCMAPAGQQPGRPLLLHAQ